MGLKEDIENAADKKPVVKIVQPAFPLCSITFIVLLILKLTKTIAISWWWVFAPFWIPLGLVVFIVMACLIGIGIIALIEYIRNK